MKTLQLLIGMIMFPLTTLSEETNNLLNQDFTNSSWSGTNKSSRHGNTIIAGVDGGNVESTVSLSDTLNASQINGGWTSTLGADIWSWNNNDQTTTMSQIITGADGTVTTQVRNISTTSSDNYTSYTDSYTQGINSQSDYDITVRFSFDESSNSIYHYATDLKNPTLTIEYSLLSTSQVAELKTMSETVYNVVEDIDFYEYIPVEEFKFEMIEQPMIEISTIEEFYFEPQAIEELNAGVVDVFQEITYDNQTSFKEVPTEIKIEEVYQPSERQTEFQTTDNSRIFESEPVREEVSTGNNREIKEEEVSVRAEGDSTSRDNQERTVEQPIGESTVGQNSTDEIPTTSEEPSEELVVASEEVDEPVGERETDGGESGDGGADTVATTEEPIESRSESVEESRTEGTTRVSNQTITVESIEKKVNETLTRIDQRLVATSLIVARAMESPLSMDNYGNTNNNIFINQLNIDGGSYDDQREYIDARDIYAESQVAYNDPVAKSQKVLQESIDNRIRAEEELRRIINGY